MKLQKVNKMKYRTFSFTDKIYERFSKNDEGLQADTIKLINLINEGKPCMVSRFGSTELQTLWYSRFYPLSLPLKKRTYYNIKNCSGFFPVTHSNLKKFYNLYREDAKAIDLLVSWRFEELFFKDWIADKPQIRKTTMDSFYSQETPWTSALKGKSILVIHPFAEAIVEQYEKNRTKLFANENILPEFADLQTMKAVQSIAGQPVGFSDWFEALESMKEQINKIKCDVALIGCGAYGLPLAAHAKRQNMCALHMGGVIQLLFGIKGKRYVENPEVAKYLNDYFIFPPEADKPKNLEIVEGGCYW